MNKEFKNILIRMPNWLGDAVMATPVLADVRNQWPCANVTVMCQAEGVSSLLWGNPYINEIFTYTRPQKWLHRSEQRDLIARIRQGKYDIGLLLTNSFSSAWSLWRGSVRARIGFATDGRSLLLTTKVPPPKTKGEEHLVITYKRLLEPLGIPLSQTRPMLFLSQKEQEEAQALLTKHQIPDRATLIGINPGAAFGSAKCWPPEKFRRLIERLAKRPNTYLLCFSDRAGANLVNGICRKMPSNVINLAASTRLRELMALIKECDLFLTNDSGPMHIAAALNVPLVALFGSTNEVATGPYGHGRVIHKHVSCSPCYRRTCPIDFRCMEQIGVDEVYDALLYQIS